MATSHITSQGQMFDMIAKLFYNDETQMGLLLAANPLLIHTVVFEAGVSLTIPDNPQSNVVASSPTGRQVIQLA